MSDTNTELLLGKVTALEKLGEEVSFLQIGRTKYMVTLVGQDLSIVDELKSYVASEVTSIRGELTDVFERDIANQLRQQLDHIQAARRRGQVAIPSALQDKVVRYVNGTVNEVKSFVFNPWCIKGTFDDIARIVTALPDAKFSGNDAKAKFGRTRTPQQSGEWQLTFKSDIMLPGAVCVAGGQLRMVNELRTFHTYDDRRMCVGNSPVGQVFALAPQMLGTQLSILNRFSPLTSDIVWNGQRLYSYPNWVLRECGGFAVTRNAMRTAEEMHTPVDDNDEVEDTSDDGDDTPATAPVVQRGWSV